MKPTARLRFDVDALRDVAGGKVFTRGEQYYRDGQVEILAIEPARVVAQVAGTENYRTVITGRGTTIAGDCSCPAFEDWGFCKHMVATALAANAAAEDPETAGEGVISRIRDHLKGRGVDALVDMIVDLAERDLDLFRKLDLAAAAAHADDKTLEPRLRKAIDSATRTRGFVDYRHAAAWAADVDAAIDAIADLASGKRAGIAIKLTERLIDRVEQAVENIDDSEGHCSVLLDRARNVHLAAARATRPEPVRFARELFARETGSNFGTFHDAAALYADVLGVEGLAEYRRLATEAWERLPPRSRKGPVHDEPPEGYHELRNILDMFAARDGDVDARIALRAGDLSSPWSYLELAEFCLAHGRGQEALRRAEEGLWIFEDSPPDTRFVCFAADLLSNAGRNGEAEAHLWRAFEKAPSLELYARLRKLDNNTARGRAIKLLETRLVNGRAPQRGNPADLLTRILVQEGMFDAAWAALHKHGASRSVKDALAHASEATHPRQAIDVYADRVEELVSAGGHPAYAEAAKLVARMAALRSATEQATYLASLQARHHRKRNFMKLLD